MERASCPIYFSPDFSLVVARRCEQRPERLGVFLFAGMLKKTGRAGVMNEAAVGHQSFMHVDPAPGALAVGKVGLRREGEVG